MSSEPRDEKPEDIRILVVDDHYLFRQGVIHTLTRQPDMVVVGEASTGAEALEKARELLPEVILLDIMLPDESGLVTTGKLQIACPYCKIIALTVAEDDDILLQTLKKGARGYLLKGITEEDLVTAVRAVCRGETYVTPAMATRLLVELSTSGPRRSSKGLDELTDRERQILELVAQGRTNKEIAEALFFSENTIKRYMTNILQKLQVRNRVEAALLTQRRLS